MMLGSALAIKAYKEGNYCGQIGIVSDSYSIETLVNSDAYLLAKKHANIFYNLSVNDVAIKGEYPKSFIEKLQADGYDLSYMKESDKLIFKSGVVDFLGVNAYDRVLVKPYTKGKTRLVANNSGNKDKKNETIVENWFQLDEDNTTLKNAWDCEIYPKSIYNLLMDLKKRYPKTSFVITENGLGYYDELIDGKVDDSYRIEFLKEYLHYMDLAIADGCKVFGYFVWSTVDLYSWINGYKKRYGLVYIDYENNNKRIPKKSYYWYKNYLESKGEKNEKN